MKILSLFDGISCARVALERAGIPVEAYYASEVDKYAKIISNKNYPNQFQLGDVRDVGKLFLKPSVSIDLLIGGSPCQDLSIAKKNRKGLDGERSGLFWEYVRILKQYKPKYFILENVNSMPKEAKELITKTLGVEPVMINAALVSAQNRKRLFWVGERRDWANEKDSSYSHSDYVTVSIEQPTDRFEYLKDILENGDSDRLKSYCIDANYAKGASWKQYIEKGRRQLVRIGTINKGGQGDRIYSPEGKSVGLSALGGGRGQKTGLYKIQKEPHGTALDYYNDTIVPNNKAKVLGTNPQSTTAVAGQLVNDNSIIRKLTPIECERLQGLPDNYTEGISNTQRYKCLGNAFNCDVVAHILSFIK